VPLLSRVAPSDECKIWKIGQNIRMDSTFEDFKGFKTIRLAKSFIFKKNNKNEREVFNVNWNNKSYFDPLEPLDEVERKIIINDIFNAQNLKGEFKINSCKISESKSLFGNLVNEKVYDWNSKKYDVNISSSLNVTNREKPEYISLNKENYFDDKSNIIFNIKKILGENKIKSGLLQGLNGTPLEKEAFKNAFISNLENGNDKKIKSKFMDC